MGPNDETDVYYLRIGGEPVRFHDFTETELQSGPDESVPDAHISLRQIEPMTMELKLAKWHRCKTRKRFVKLLMAEGLSRNGANEFAYFARCFYRSYQDAYLDHKLGA